MCFFFSFSVRLVVPMLLLFYSLILNTASSEVTDPKFTFPISNVTVPEGREAILLCVVQDLGAYKVAWLRVDTQTILTIQNHVITKNHKVSIQYSEKNTWLLRIKDIKETDRGWYMCQINTDPMKSQMGYLDVVVSPDILDFPTSTDMVVREGSNVTLKCAATGSPQPTITWRREGGDVISIADGLDVVSMEGTNLFIPRVNRLHMGAYLCIASNGVPPSVSKRIMLIVHFPPMISIQNQLVGAVDGQRITLECQSEAYPKSINYWTKEKGEIVPQGGKFEPILTKNAYKVVMKLSIKSVQASDIGSYKCVAKNSLGDTDGTIKLYRIPRNSVNLAESYDTRYKDTTRKAAIYDASMVTEHESGSLQKRKDIPLGEHSEESYEISNSSITLSKINRTNLISYCIKLIVSILIIEFNKCLVF